MTHLSVPQWVAIVIGIVLEGLGIATVHVALDLYKWNLKPAVNKDKGAWEKAPLHLAVLTCGIYFVAVLFLSVVLETRPELAPWAPTIFPFVTVAGVGTLAIISQHDARVARYARKDTGMVGIIGLYHAWVARRIAFMGNGRPAQIPVLPEPQVHDAGKDASVALPVCDLCHEPVASGNMGSHRRWHCVAIEKAKNDKNSE
jgi:hypothetical protein